MAASPRALTEAERLDWLRLIRTENVGPITFLALLQRFGSAAAALEALPGLSRQGGRRKAVATPARTEASREIEATEAADARLVALGEADYPARLAEIADPPPLLAVKGAAHLLNRPSLAVVGARNASANGVRFTRRLAAELGARDLVIASGMARGIDTAAHRGALQTGTVAVLAGGIDVVYPAENEDLYAEIAEVGVIIAESPTGTEPQARHFPRRNRLISGVALGALVVEAAPRSGSLITARMALEQGREVFAVPGSPLDPRSRGTNHLLRQGATLTENADDVMEVLEGIVRRPLEAREAGPIEAPAPAAPDEDELARGRGVLLEMLGPSPVEVDELMRQCHLSAAAVLTILLELELAGRLRRSPGNQVTLLS